MPSSRTRIKICGVRDPRIAMAAVEAGADAIGLVFAQGSAREVTAAQAAEVVREIPALVTPVALFVNPTLDEVRKVYETTGISTMQLHGQESPEFAASLSPLKVIKALPFKGADVARELEPWRERIANVRAILIDTPPPADATTPGHAGGTGQAFDWIRLASLLQTGIWNGLPAMVLAGGLTPGNVGEAIRLLRPYAVDVSSGVESSRGVKDASLIRAFCEAVDASR